jgi:hypothetical protein
LLFSHKINRLLAYAAAAESLLTVMYRLRYRSMTDESDIS